MPAEPVLRLTEFWRGEAAGGRLVRAGVAGRVEWVSEGAKAKVHTVQFMVQVSAGVMNRGRAGTGMRVGVVRMDQLGRSYAECGCGTPPAQT